MKDTKPREPSPKARRPVEVPESDLARAADRFYNRELSWLQFNHRVLEEAANGHHPLLERLRFLSISASNLDEFFMVRVSGVYEQMHARIDIRSDDGRTPAEQVERINEAVARLTGDQQLLWSQLRDELKTAGIEILEANDLSADDHGFLEQTFI